MVAPRIMLLQTLAACPAPAPPQWTMRLPMASSTGLPAAKASAVPPHMKVSVPATAPPVPPETGASSASRPLAPASACTTRALSTSMVEESISSAPSGTAPAISSQTTSTCLPAGSMVTTTCARRTQSSALSASARPAAVAASRAAGDRSKPVTPWPARRRLSAMGRPMLPSPMNATSAIPTSPQRPTSSRATIRRMISLVPSRI